MHPLNLDAYLQKIGYRGAVAPREDVLQRLVNAHVLAIPFENLDVLWGRPVPLDIPSLEAKLVRGQRGGYCFEHNTLFAAVLEAVGFSVTRLGARVRWNAATPRPRTHTLLEIGLPDGPRIADVGFGAAGLRGALRLEEGEQRVSGRSFTIRQEPHLFVLGVQTPGESRSDLYAFTREPQLPADYEMANWYTSTHPGSYFRSHLLVMRPTEEGEWMLVDTELSVRRGAVTETRTLASRREVLTALSDGFGIAMPAEVEALDLLARIPPLVSLAP